MTRAGILTRLALILGLGLALLPMAAPAQTDDRSYLVALLEDNLSDAGRRVTITGFAGALSSVARIDEMTIADGEGVWITLRDLSLGWDRAALLSGKVTVTALTAGEIILDRLPVMETSGMPDTEGAAFALPELPVSVTIGRIAADKITLGKDILGEEVQGTIEAALSLANGEGQITINIDRQDAGPDGYFALQASYANATGILAVSLDAQEQAEGISVRLLQVPGAPSAGVTIKGSGPLDDFTAEVTLQTDGQPRLTGQIALLGRAEGQRDFSADLSGDLAPVFWPAYRAFLGDSLRLTIDGSSLPDGRFDLSSFALASGALNATGNLALAADGLPERFSMNVAIAGDEGALVLLPLTTEVPTSLTSARLSLGFDAADSDAWTLGGLIMGLDRSDFTAQSLSLSGGGNIARDAAGKRITADLSFIGFGLQPSDPALAKAMGPSASGTLKAAWTAGSGQTEITDLSLSGEDYTFVATGAVQGLETGFAIDGRAKGTFSDLSRLADLTGLALGGQGDVTLSGQTSALGAAFDLRFAANGEDLAIGIPRIDTLIAGMSQVAGQVTRDETGTTLRDIQVRAGDLTATLNGTLTKDAVAVNADLALADLGALGPRFRGSVTGAAAYIGTLTDGIATLTGQASGLGIGQTEIDRVLAGPADLGMTVAMTKGVLRLQDARLDGTSLDVTAEGRADGAIGVQGQLANFNLILPEFPGILTMTGSLRPTGAGTLVDLALNGPAQVRGQLSGSLEPRFDRANLTFVGQSLADLANPILKPRALSGQMAYDLRLSGPLSIQSVSGRVTLTNGRLADPSLSFGIDAIAGTAEISSGRARINVTSAVTTGGTVAVTGQTSIVFPFQGDLAVDLDRIVLREPRLYETLVSGALQVNGPLAGGATVSGAVDLGRSELRIPSSGLSGSEPIPKITHIAEPADVRATRLRAGLIGEGAATNGRSGSGRYLLDILVRAPNQIFLRGRGLDAELGGSLRLRGTTADISPQGSFDLIRGRLDLVGRRLVLTQAALRLEGEFVPRVDIVASIEDSDIISTIRISGPASAPVLTFESSPELPDEEVLAQLLFGERLQTLSAFQAAQLAVAVRTLAGVGGEGLVGKIRKGSGLDNLDITTDEAGNASLTAGKYLSEKVYTEVTIDQTGKTQIDLNLDVKSHITLKAKVDSEGDTGVGIYLEKNY